ncbi:MAG: amidohydrolase family protein, partial [Ferruginibacter sp.]|nr:amidohydrolase family protein [Ferruginibacter sp.]
NGFWQSMPDDWLEGNGTRPGTTLLMQKKPPLRKCPGRPALVQHALPLMLYYYEQGKISLENIVRKMSHAVAECFQIKERGFIREGYFADLVLIDLNKPFTVSPQSVLYKCGWSPFENFQFPASVEKTFVNGNLVYENGTVNNSYTSERLYFNR